MRHFQLRSFVALLSYSNFLQGWAWLPSSYRKGKSRHDLLCFHLSEKGMLGVTCTILPNYQFLWFSLLLYFHIDITIKPTFLTFPEHFAETFETSVSLTRITIA
jgi:hypothetical protein